MKEGIHPKYEVTSVGCACGNTFETRSTRQNIKLDICSNCHPFYTGQAKLMDTAGRVERFTKRFAKTEGKTVVRKPKTFKSTGAPQHTPKTGKKVLRNTPTAAKPGKEDKSKKAGK